MEMFFETTEAGAEIGDHSCWCLSYGDNPDPECNRCHGAGVVYGEYYPFGHMYIPFSDSQVKPLFNALGLPLLDSGCIGWRDIPKIRRRVLRMNNRHDLRVPMQTPAYRYIRESISIGDDQFIEKYEALVKIAPGIDDEKIKDQLCRLDKLLAMALERKYDVSWDIQYHGYGAPPPPTEIMPEFIIK